MYTDIHLAQHRRMVALIISLLLDAFLTSHRRNTEYLQLNKSGGSIFGISSHLLSTTTNRQ